MTPTQTGQITLIEALNEAIREEMRRDERVAAEAPFTPGAPGRKVEKREVDPENWTIC